MNMLLSQEELSMLLSDVQEKDLVFEAQNSEASEGANDVFENIVTHYQTLQIEARNTMLSNTEKGDIAAVNQQLNRLTLLNRKMLNELKQTLYFAGTSVA
ncbi:hypothetical protein [Pseudoalteromonas sp. G4]|uniref:hypothetical protein n=1 Tax=Pseudoalteromonas sp. G4 TaxID=2992761 RepID=UPI00237DE2A2|nr:hypothetical protein [Pseudoalteromonas sp. G4]MDE3270582.1 hypothetical protein [Pseudoalteromonas sp. G4]